ncbi:mechanosensitive ion channel domain-containing protein [Yanghanlia caeni]|uniref:Small-conductance mechanosensitive channel n=1 Tax=Yanghanlia caeni TaxID=3064283 RepID=A0ABU1D287_9BURK|nr:mechanosensitive ion channel family protein [Alcaligenaceae bacterium LG-2]NGR09076.1 mechanosensitive ion channel family protein [bacterium SGD-2]HZH55589.1 mechanosensitive ion channel family protein [Burkholderiaceae bacterium]
MSASLSAQLPVWTHDWLDSLALLGQLLLIALVAMLLQRSIRRVILKAGELYDLPRHLVRPAILFTRWAIVISATLLILGRLGVSGTVLWTAFTGFAAVAAVAFFAAWSVLSNLFCAILIFTARPLRLGDHVEILDTAEKPGARGEVVDINLLYITLEDSTASQPGVYLQIPNALIFQRVIRRWRGATPPQRPAPRDAADPASVE